MRLLNTSSPLEAGQCGKRTKGSKTETAEISWKLFILVFYHICKKKNGQNRVKIFRHYSSVILKYGGLWSLKIRGKKQTLTEKVFKSLIFSLNIFKLKFLIKSNRLVLVICYVNFTNTRFRLTLYFPLVNFSLIP